MPYRFRESPWWVRALMFGLYFGVCISVLQLARHHLWQSSALGGLLGGVVFGGVMGPVTARWRRTERAGMTPEELAASDCFIGGPLPDDPESRDLARGIGEQHIVAQAKQLKIAVVFTAAAILACAVLAVMSSPWYWIFAAIFVVMTAWEGSRYRLMTDRMRELRDGEPAPLATEAD